MFCVQKHHRAREVFLTTSVQLRQASDLLWPASVAQPAAFDAAVDPQDDDYVCKWVYNVHTHVMAPRNE